MNINEISPELFIWELYDPNGPFELSDALHCAVEFGYCDASRLAVRPRSGLYALMVTWEDGYKYWFHIDPEQLVTIRERLERCHHGPHVHPACVDEASRS